MSSQQVSTSPNFRGFAIRFGVILLATSGFIVLLMGGRGTAYVGQAISHARLHAPNLRLIAEAPIAIQIHLATVSAAVVLASVQMVGPKGRTFHRVMGWILSILLLVTAIASLFIPNPRGGLFNPFQIFSVWTLIAVPWAIVSAHRHDVRRHASIMTGLYLGALVIAGLLTFLPGRLMWRVFFG